MLTNNGIKQFLTGISPSAAAGAQKYTDINGNISSGTSYNNDYIWSWGATSKMSSPNNGSLYMAIGTGSTPASVIDIDLANRLTDEPYNIISGNTSSSGFSDGKCTVTKTLEYTGNDQIAISEIGLFYYRRNNTFILVAREVLDSPITVNNGDTFTVSMVIG